jgi:Mg2+ and Co2+ transporter CorA
LADDVVTIISTDTNTNEESGGSKASAVQPATKVVKVKGGPFALTRLIKKLDKQEKEVEKIGKQLDEAEQQVMNSQQEQKVKKLEQQLSKAEERVMNTRKKMKALADKFELRDILNDIDDDEEFEERLDEVLEDGVDVFSYAGEEVLYSTQRLISAITKTANQAIFPHGVDDDDCDENGDEDCDENKREE